jgi:hypothetical protein
MKKETEEKLSFILGIIIIIVIFVIYFVKRG